MAYSTNRTIHVNVQCSYKRNRKRDTHARSIVGSKFWVKKNLFRRLHVRIRGGLRAQKRPYGAITIFFWMYPRPGMRLNRWNDLIIWSRWNLSSPVTWCKKSRDHAEFRSIIRSWCLFSTAVVHARHQLWSDGEEWNASKLSCHMFDRDEIDTITIFSGDIFRIALRCNYKLYAHRELNEDSVF